MTAPFEGLAGVMFDLDGVLYVGGEALPGAAEAIAHVKAMGLPCRFVTNTTTKSRDALHRKVSAMGLPIEPHELISAASAGVSTLRGLGDPRCLFVLEDDTRADFTEFTEDEANPELIVIGDVGNRWDFTLINRLFRLVMNGAEILALHKGRFFQVDDGLEIDTGAFIAALEYATGKTARVVGKPERAFFELALTHMGRAAGAVIMVGDDIDSDIGGAQRAGIRGVLVRTGKYREDLVARSSVRPDGIIDSVADLASLIDRPASS